MKKVVIGVILVAGLFLNNYFGNELELYNTVNYTVQAGDTMYGIADRFYHGDANSECFDEFWCRISNDNAKLTKNGRFLQPGDVVRIDYYREQ